MADPELMPETSAPTGTGPSGSRVVNPGVDYRQVQQQTEMVKPWHLPNNGAASEATELASALKGFSNQAGAIGNKLGAESGQAAGGAAGTSDTFQPKTGLAAITAFGQNYNAAAHVSYVAQTQNSITTAIDAAEQAYPRDPAAFQNQVQAIKDATLKETPSLYAPEIQNHFERAITASTNRIQEATTRAGQEDAVAAFSGLQPERIKTAVRDAADLPKDQSDANIQQALHTENTMIDGLVSMPGSTISKERGETLKAEALAKMTEAVHTQFAEKTAGNWISSSRTAEDVTLGDKALAAYANDPANSNEDKARVAAEYARQREQYEHDQSNLHAPEISAFTSSLEQLPGQKEGRGASGPAVDAQIDDMRKKGWISTEKAGSLAERAALNASKGLSDDTDTYNFTRAWHGDDPKFDPKDPKALKAVDVGFKTLVAANNAPRGSVDYENFAVSTLTHVGAVPPVVSKGIIADLRSGDPNRAVAAAKLQGRLREADSLADVYGEDTKSAAFGDVLERNTEAGMPAPQAYQMARDQVDPPRDVQEQRKLDYSNAVKTVVDKNPHKANADMLQTKLNDAGVGPPGRYFGHADAPTAPPTQRAEYEDLTKEFFTRTGNIEQAQDLAFQQVQKTWHATTINGTPEMMKWGPTKEEEPAFRAAIAFKAKQFGLSDDPTTMKLTPFGGTSLSEGRLWNLTHANGDLALDDKNQPITIDKGRGKPTYDAILAKQKATDDADKAAKIAAGKAMRGQSAARAESLAAGAAAGG